MSKGMISSNANLSFYVHNGNWQVYKIVSKMFATYNLTHTLILI